MANMRLVLHIEIPDESPLRDTFEVGRIVHGAIKDVLPHVLTVYVKPEYEAELEA
jgi:hypothetical protein